jgi:hypothetical protein
LSRRGEHQGRRHLQIEYRARTTARRIQINHPCSQTLAASPDLTTHQLWLWWRVQVCLASENDTPYLRQRKSIGDLRYEADMRIARMRVPIAE